jgi:hypothetical protein
MEAYDVACKTGDFSRIIRDLASKSFPGKSVNCAKKREAFVDAASNILTKKDLVRPEEGGKFDMKWPPKFHDDAKAYDGPFKERYNILEFMTSDPHLQSCITTYVNHSKSGNPTVRYIVILIVIH